MTDPTLRAELQRARAHTDALFELVAEPTLYERPIAERHRLIFYLGHLDAFDWNQVARGALDEPSFDLVLDQLFEAGIDPPPGCGPQDTAADWPRLDDVRAYVRRVRARLDALWDEAPAERQAVAVEHRWMHAETLCYLLHRLPHVLKRGRGRAHRVASQPLQQDFVDVPAGATRLGQRDGEFGWDNEFPSFAVDVPEFAIGRYKVTNAEYLRFVDDGGPPPPFWVRGARGWWLRRMFDDVSLPLNEPVYVTHRMAHAYADWAGASLPTEAEWQRAAFDGDERPFPWGMEEPRSEHGHFDFAGWDPVPVNAHTAGASPYGAEQMHGNGWEWTSTPFSGFDGFAARDYYPGYSANFFDGDHWVLKGGSPRTARRLLRPSFRNWFRGDYPFAYTAFRLAQR